MDFRGTDSSSRIALAEKRCWGIGLPFDQRSSPVSLGTAVRRRVTFRCYRPRSPTSLECRLVLVRARNPGEGTVLLTRLCGSSSRPDRGFDAIAGISRGFRRTPATSKFNVDRSLVLVGLRPLDPPPIGPTVRPRRKCGRQNRHWRSSDHRD